MDRRNYIIIIVAVFLVAIALRITLGLVNTEAYDNHVEVLKIIIDEHRIPESADCFECYHPKLYYIMCAGLYSLFPGNLVVLAQMVSVVSGIALLVVVLLFLTRFVDDLRTRLITFSLVALNPGLIAINAQVTNDSLAIFLAVTATYLLYRYALSGSRRHFVLGTAFLVVSLAAKKTPIFVVGAVAVVFVCSIYLAFKSAAPYRKTAAALLCFVLAVLFTVPFLGGYYNEYVSSGDPFTINVRPCPWPNLIEPNYYPPAPVLRPGVTSIVNSFFTFRLVDLERNPTITNGFVPIPWHRTSLWTQLYGRLHFAQFTSYPPSWATDDSSVLNLGRSIFLLALVPSVIFIIGILVVVRRCVTNRRQPSYFVEHKEWMFLVLLFAGLAFITVFAARYWDFSTMKGIYIFPCMLSVVALFAVGLQYVLGHYADRRVLRVIYASIGLLLVLYIADIVALIAQLV